MTNKQRRDRVRKLLDDLRPYHAEFSFGPDDRFIVTHDGNLPSELEQRLDEAIDDIERVCVEVEFERILNQGRGPN